ITICNSSQDDTGSNPLSPLIAVAKAGYRGGIITAGIGTESGPAAGNSTTPIQFSTLTPTQVSSVNTIANTLSFAGRIKGLPAAQKQSLPKALNGLTTAQAGLFSTMIQGSQYNSLTGCAYQSNSPYAMGGVGALVDARQDATMQAVYGITATSSSTS